MVLASFAEKFINSISSSDKTLLHYPSMFHETFNDEGKEEIIKQMIQWLQKRT